jgi:hypothetical protein
VVLGRGVQTGLVAISSTKLAANASKHANRKAARLAEQILAEAAAVAWRSSARPVARAAR